MNLYWNPLGIPSTVKTVESVIPDFDAVANRYSDQYSQTFFLPKLFIMRSSKVLHS